MYTAYAFCTYLLKRFIRCNKSVNLHEIILCNSIPLSLLGFSSQGWRGSIWSEVLKFVLFIFTICKYLSYYMSKENVQHVYGIKPHTFILYMAIPWFFFYCVNLQSGHTWWIHFCLFCHIYPLCAYFGIGPFLLHLLWHKCKDLNRSINIRNEQWKEWKCELF